MMASKTVIQEIDKNFLQCPVCMERFKEPKILPCLHRYCENCLVETITEQDTEVECPTCREIYPLPPNRIDGFKTDFNTKNMIEFIQSKLPQKYISGSPKDTPMCHNHPGRPLELFCKTCGNQPICVSCTIDPHEGHNLQEVSDLAKVEREKLKKSIEELMRYKDKIYSKPEEMKAAKRKLGQAVHEKKAELQEEFKLKEYRTKREIREKDEELEQQRKKLEKVIKKENLPRKQQLEKELNAARNKYDRFCKEEKETMEKEFEKLLQENEPDKEELLQQLEEMNKGIKHLLTSLQAEEEEKLKKIEELSDHFDSIIQQFESVTAIASSILAENHDWTDVQCIPDICGVINPLIEDVKKDCPELKTLSDIMVGGLSAGIPCGVADITETGETLVSIERLIGKEWRITGITGSQGGILVTGAASEYHSHISVISGKIMVKQKLIRSTSPRAFRFCKALTAFKAATASWGSEIGIYDVRDNSYKKADMRQFSSWPAGQDASCVAVNDVNNRIIVGGRDTRKVYVFSSYLVYLHTMTLPEIIAWPHDMTVHRGNLLVCDAVGSQGAYVVTMKEGTPCKVIHEFTKPVVSECIPFSVCRDKHGLTYILWRGRISGKRRSILVQYSQNGQTLLQTKVVGCKDDARRIATAETAYGEKVLIATYSTGKVITYGLEKRILEYK